MPFHEQVQIFSRARLVIGQHGAGLGNCVWMPPHSSVIEFSSDLDFAHFKILSGLKKQRYCCHKTNQTHTRIDPRRLIHWIQEELTLWP